jgi:hypothetical protein
MAGDSSDVRCLVGISGSADTRNRRGGKTAFRCMYSLDYGSFVAQGMNRLGARDCHGVSEYRRQRDEEC